MSWFLELERSLQAAAVLGVLATLVLVGAAKWSAQIVAGLGVAATVLAAVPAIATPTAATFPLLIVLSAALLCVLLVRHDELADERHRAETTALILFGSAGACALVSATNLLTILVGFESMSLSVAVLAGIGRGERSLEAAFRFFVLGAIAAALLVYGTALHFYATGSLEVGAPAVAGDGLQQLRTIGHLLLLLGVSFELAVVPLQFGALGVIQAGPIGGVGFAMTVSKVGAAFALGHVVGGERLQQDVLVALAVTTIVWGTLGALAQRTLRGLLANSAVAQGGFVALGIACGAGAHATVCFYLAVYVAASALVLAAISGDGDEIDLTTMRSRPLGTMRRLALVAGLMSLAGMPPTPGLLAKFLVLARSWETAGMSWTVVAALGGVFGALYYMRPVPDLLSGGAPIDGRSQPTFGVRIAIVAAAVVTVVCTVAPYAAMRLA
ncbi:MAG: hypothetical protein JNK15_22675 [Planctomycetes bacterium]|nr:hypothetical protein [Planctomycetota bacterium]